MKRRARHIEPHHDGVRIELGHKGIEHFEAGPDAVAQLQGHPLTVTPTLNKVSIESSASPAGVLTYLDLPPHDARALL